MFFKRMTAIVIAQMFLQCTNFTLGPSPTLTTKQAFADVMPWFKTTVDLNSSEDELENDFKNDQKRR